MCYVHSVGVRELRQSASVLLKRIAETGEPIEITNHGRAVAHLVPIQTRGRYSLEDLIAAGLARPGRGSILDVEPIELPPGSPTMSELLEADRGDR